MKYQIDYVYDDYYRESKNQKFFDADNDDAAIQKYQDFKKECEYFHGLITGDECRGLIRLNSDGTTTKII